MKQIKISIIILGLAVIFVSINQITLIKASKIQIDQLAVIIALFETGGGR